MLRHLTAAQYRLVGKGYKQSCAAVQLGLARLARRDDFMDARQDLLDTLQAMAIQQAQLKVLARSLGVDLSEVPLDGNVDVALGCQIITVIPEED